ncbi:uncharacterized protein LOC135843770 [Planococcus citri]|uniref:uncharacterized protein LOC135843770 n=1 Tax=Planococcus citri TaxID=170843 RepID=UPI0031F9499F
MELGSKSKKRFQLKSSRQDRNESRNWFDCTDDKGPTIGEDDGNFGTFSRTNVVKTPVRPLKAKTASPIAHTLSPQFRVGWNDGSQKSQKSVCDMGSPVSAIPARRKIRRCPENLLAKISPPAVEPKDSRKTEGNSCDILQCINWAKSLIESSNFQSPIEETPEVPDKKIAEITESIKDTSLDIALDDSSNELMIMCSQAIEESVSSGKLTLENKKSQSEKHHITPIRDNNPSKRFRPQFASSTKSDVANFDRRLNDSHPKSNNVSSRPMNTPTKIPLLVSQTASSKNLLNVDGIFKRPNQSGANNNSENFKDFNKNVTNSGTFRYSRESRKENEMVSPFATPTPVSNQSLSDLSNIDIKSHLDDEDEIFCSLDFNFLDSLQTKPIVQPKPASKPTTNEIKPQIKNKESVKLDTKPLVTKYTKQEIEKRRLEAKKRLLLKKHKSM